LKAHTTRLFDDKQRSLEYLSLSSLLMRLLDLSTVNPLSRSSVSAPTKSVASVKAFADGPTRSKPAIEKLKTKLVYLWADERDVWHISSKEDGTIGLILPFYYNPTKSAAKTELCVRAHVVFKDKLSGATTRVFSAGWLDEDLNKVTLRPGDEKAVVLLFVDRDGTPRTVQSAREDHEYFSELEHTKVREHTLSLEEKTVDIILLSADDEIEYKEAFSVDLPSLAAFG
jgi:hypothetical protein